MSQKFRVRELKIKSGTADRSGLVTENMTSSTANKVVGNTFKNVVVNENGEFVVDTLLVAWNEVIYKSSNYTITTADKNKVIAFDTTSWNLTATLPTWLSNGDKVYVKVHKWANELVVNTSGSDKIDDTATSITLKYATWERSWVEFVYDGSWKFQAVLDFTGTVTPAIVYINKIFVSNASASSVKVYNLTTNTVEATIATVSNPYAIRANNQKTRMIVPWYWWSGFNIIDMTNNTLVWWVYQSWWGFYSGAFHPTATKLFVPRQNSNVIYVYDYTSMTLLTTITVPHSLTQNYSCITPDGTKLLVSSSATWASLNRVDVYDTTTYAHLWAITWIGNKALNIVADNNFFYVLLDTDRVLKKYTIAWVLQWTSPTFTAWSYCEWLDLSPDWTYLAVCNTTSVYKVDASTGNHLASVWWFASPAWAQSTSFRWDWTKLYVWDNISWNTVKEITTSSWTITNSFSGWFSQIESILYV